METTKAKKEIRGANHQYSCAAVMVATSVSSLPIVAGSYFQASLSSVSAHW
jgi:hypothetical protein